MRALVVYESMYGNTHLIANAIAEGLRMHAETVVVPVGEADSSLVETSDLIVVGGPTHAHGMSRDSTRQGAVAAAAKPGSELALDPDAAGSGLREWFASVDRFAKPAAAFDTRVDLAVALTGRASKGIARKLRRHGATLIAKPESFLVTKDSHLEPNEEARARDWGAGLGSSMDRIALHRVSPG